MKKPRKTAARRPVVGSPTHEPAPSASRPPSHANGAFVLRPAPR